MAFGFWGFTFFTFGPLAAGLKDFCVASRSGAARLRRRPPVVAAVIESGCAAACWAAKSGWTRRSARRPELRCGEGLGEVLSARGGWAEPDTISVGPTALARAPFRGRAARRMLPLPAAAPGWMDQLLPSRRFVRCLCDSGDPGAHVGSVGGRPGRWFGRGRRRSGRSGRGFADWHLCPGRCWCGAPGLMWPVRGYVGRR